MFLYRVTLSSRLDRNIIAVDAAEISLLFFFAFDAICGRRDLFAGVFSCGDAGLFVEDVAVVAAVTIVSATLSITSTGGVPVGIAMSMIEDYMMAREINRVCGEVDNVVQESLHFLEELDTLAGQPVLEKMGEFFKEIQRKDKERVLQL
ncbi:hypothetical protein Tco_1288456 [Tanacetum coccineum]